MSLDKLNNESELDYKYRLLLDKAKGELSEGWEEIIKTLNIGLSKDTIRKGTIFLPEYEEYMIGKFSVDNSIPNYKETVELKGDGSTISDKLVQMTNAEMKDSEFLLKAHGFNPKEFELVSAKNSIWNVSAGKDPNKTLYASKISVKPNITGFDVDKLLEYLKVDLKPLVLDVKEIKSDRMLEIPLVDMHFGVADFNYYVSTLIEIKHLIESKHWDVIYIPIGNDLLHNDTFDGKTSNGTQITPVDMEKAWSDAYKFYEFLFQVALKKSNKVVSHYVCGNHDKVMSYGLVQALSKVFVQVEWDTSIANKKLFTWKDVAILSAHGDKGGSRLPKTILKEYGKVIADKKVVEIHTGHLHYNASKDDFGVVYRTLPTKAISDDWHTEQSFLGAGKYFSLFEYKPDLLKTIHNI